MDKLEPSPDSGTQPPLLDSLQISEVDGPETSVERTVTKPYSYNTENGTVGPRSDVLEPEAERSRADADATETYVEDPESDVQGLENGSNAAGSDVARTVLTSNASMVPELARKLRETLELPNDSNPRKIKLLCGHIDYRKNTYKFRKIPCFTQVYSAYKELGSELARIGDCPATLMHTYIHTYTHTHTHIYIYIYNIYIRERKGDRER